MLLNVISLILCLKLLQEALMLDDTSTSFTEAVDKEFPKSTYPSPAKVPEVGPRMPPTLADWKIELDRIKRKRVIDRIRRAQEKQIRKFGD